MMMLCPGLSCQNFPFTGNWVAILGNWPCIYKIHGKDALYLILLCAESLVNWFNSISNHIEVNMTMLEQDIIQIV